MFEFVGGEPQQTGYGMDQRICVPVERASFLCW